MSSNAPAANSQKAVELHVGDFHVNELAADKAGALSPFGSDVEFPWPLDQIRYTHPRPEDRPHLADGR
jgi:hypothetical protein